ncbi:hypothetical protein BU24DRAFT_484376 [Aaosphaeria arxii CBS 175.79]|uniref:Uncharacterized protein n=1 Tax=Aaosphaeria arxii CBS 175.79 TaxID=1450172 RepID=A0A6A5XI69_9PLEO|nr:uncharacterized protein BU24DRAFT_484376 [Aaosphaeria arxii CBS 175.79]KAF2012653.1 hypothetical protein BU24DRAFT_484376 [Aaosphaeria arxii CBS 175.79]
MTPTRPSTTAMTSGVGGTAQQHGRQLQHNQKRTSSSFASEETVDKAISNSPVETNSTADEVHNDTSITSETSVPGPNETDSFLDELFRGVDWTSPSTPSGTIQTTMPIPVFSQTVTAGGPPGLSSFGFGAREEEVMEVKYPRGVGLHWWQGSVVGVR